MRRYSRDSIAEHLRSQPLSGLSVRAYCEKHGIGLSTFGYWRKRACDRSPEHLGRTLFAEVGLLGGRAPLYDVRFADGVTVTFYASDVRVDIRGILNAVRIGSGC